MSSSFMNPIKCILVRHIKFFFRWIRIKMIRLHRVYFYGSDSLFFSFSVVLQEEIGQKSILSVQHMINFLYILLFGRYLPLFFLSSIPFIFQSLLKKKNNKISIVFQSIKTIFFLSSLKNRYITNCDSLKVNIFIRHKHFLYTRKL